MSFFHGLFFIAYYSAMRGRAQVTGAKTFVLVATLT